MVTSKIQEAKILLSFSSSSPEPWREPVLFVLMILLKLVLAKGTREDRLLYVYEKDLKIS